MKVSQQVNHKYFKKGDLIRIIYRINGYIHDQVVEIKDKNSQSINILPISNAGDFQKESIELKYDQIISFEKP